MKVDQDVEKSLVFGVRTFD